MSTNVALLRIIGWHADEAKACHIVTSLSFVHSPLPHLTRYSPCSQTPQILELSAGMGAILSSLVFGIALLTKFKWDRFLPCDFDPERDVVDLHGKVAIVTGAK